MQAVIWNFRDLDDSMLLPQEDRFDAGIRAALIRGAIDFLLVHYVDGAYQHYDSVRFADGSSWEVSAETKGESV